MSFFLNRAHSTLHRQEFYFNDQKSLFHANWNGADPTTAIAQLATGTGTSPAAPATKKKAGKFQPEWLARFGLEITATDPATSVQDLCGVAFANSEKMSQTLKVGNERRLVTPSFSILLDFTVIVNKSLKSIQGQSTLVNEQTQIFQKLASDLREEGRVQGPLINGETVQPTEDRYINGSYYAVEEGKLEFIQNADLLVVESIDKLKDSHPDQYLDILHCVCVMYVDAVVGIKKIMIERDESNVGVNRLPPVLPSELARMSRAVFNDLLVLQRPRLGAFYGEKELIRIGREFKDFLSQ